MIGTRRKSLVAPVDQHDLCETLHRCSSQYERVVSQYIQPQEYRVGAYSAIADSSNARRVTDSRGEKDFEDASPQCLANSSKDEGDGDGSFSMADGVTGEKLVASSSRSISNGKGIQ